MYYSYVCAAVASSTTVSDPVGARKLGRASIGLSVSAVILTVVLIVIVVVIDVVARETNCTYRYNGLCYRDRRPRRGPSWCVGDGGYCYY